MGTTLGLYFPLDKAAANATREKVNRVAQHLGYSTAAELLIAIAENEVSVVSNKIIVTAPRDGWRREKIGSGDWRGNLADPVATVEHYYSEDKRAIVTVIERKDGELEIGPEVVIEQRDGDDWQHVGYGSSADFRAVW